ncbi:MAG: phosphoribosyl-AMP cyclohydrolase [Brevinematales bacterium]|nr:phosphoribosyl-AMP cyclohydrolase [Brevinematales bacterium]
MIQLDYSKLNGLVTAVTVDAETGEVLMVAFMNEEAFTKTVETGKVHYFSRSRGKLWLKGESSGNVQEVKEILVDCDADAVVVKVKQTGPACHEGYKSCFFRKIEDNGGLKIVLPRLEDPEKMYGKK